MTTSNEVWAGEIGAVYEEGTAETTGQAVVSEVDTEDKTVTITETETVGGLTEKQRDSITFTPEEEAAGKFTYLLPFVKKAGSVLSAKAMARVLYRLAEFPLGESLDLKKQGFRDPAETQLFRLMYEVNAAKNIILTSMQKETSLETGEKGVENVDENKNNG